MSKTIKDITGLKSGKLTALRPTGKTRNKKMVWLCSCECGNEIEVLGTSISRGTTKSCGCITKKHGMFGTRIYNVWHTMKERCYVKTQISYPNYGGRGIKVCDEWQEFIPFMEWAYKSGYDENAKRGECTLDRIDPNGDYCPENCRWVNASVQSNNKTTNVVIEYNGKIDTLSNHARSVGISPVLAEQRFLKGMRLSDVFKVGRVCNIKRVAQYDKKMNLIKIYDSSKQASIETGIILTNIQGCVSGHRKSCGEYIFKYLKEG